MMENLRLITGMIIKASYSERKHKIVNIIRGCNCPRYSDELGLTNSGMHKGSPEHIHIFCKDLEDNMNSYFNGFIEKEDKILSVWNPHDELQIISIPKNYQLELFN